MVCRSARTAITHNHQQQKPYHEMCARQTYTMNNTHTKTHTCTPFEASTLSSFFKTANFYCSLIANDSIRGFNAATHPVTTESTEILTNTNATEVNKWLQIHTHTHTRLWMCFVSRFLYDINWEFIVTFAPIVCFTAHRIH